MKMKNILAVFVLCGLSIVGVYFYGSCNANEKLTLEFRPQKHTNLFEVRELKSLTATDSGKKMLVYILRIPINYFDGEREISYGEFLGETRVIKLSKGKFKTEFYCEFRLSNQMTSAVKESDSVYVAASFDVSKDTVETIKGEDFAPLRDDLVENLNNQVVSFYDMNDKPAFIDGSKRLIDWLIGAELSIFPERVIRAVTLYDETIAESSDNLIESGEEKAPGNASGDRYE